MKIIQIKVTDEQNTIIRNEALKIGLPTTAYLRSEILKKIKQMEDSQN